MSLSTIGNWKFWGVWAAAMAVTIIAFIEGMESTTPMVRMAFVVGFIVVVTALALIAAKRQQVRSGARRSPAASRYLKRFLPAMGAYTAIMVGAIWLHENNPPTGALAYIVAVAPALPLLVGLWAIGRYMIEEDDEFERMVMVRSYLMATGATLAVCTVVGFLQSFGLAPWIPLWAVFPTLAAFMGAAQGWVRWTYR